MCRIRTRIFVPVLASIALLAAPACSGDAPEEAAPAPSSPAVTEAFAFAQLSPPIGPHGEVRWPTDADTDVVRFTYRVVPRRTGREGEWAVAEEDRVRGIVLIPPQSDGRGRLSPLSGSAILGERLLPPEGWTARRAEWMGGEVLWFQAGSGDLDAEGVEFGLEMDKGDGWPRSFGATYTCGVALTRDGELPTATDGTPARLHNLVGPAGDSNVVWWWFRLERESPSDGISSPPPISLPIGPGR